MQVPPQAVSGEKRRPSGIGKLILFLAAMLLVYSILVWFQQQPASTASPNATATPDASELLIANCGRPSSDDSTAYDRPRPPIPTRIIEYKARKLRFLFIPGDGAKVGDTPPYRWKLMGITDMSTRDASKARVVSPEEAAARMPCWTGHK